jgi:putative two-component system response regulator
MSHYSAAIAQKMGLRKKTVETILYSAPMHDIGKIGIPDGILLKAGKLDAEEWRIMKGHTIIGANILKGSRIGFVRMGAMIALTHHEKWDGSGYPNGLKGRQIPLAGRIVTLADVFDALTSKRTYKEAFPVEKSNRIIEEGRGKHFDPEVVDAFFAIQDEILHIKELFEDHRHDPVDLFDRTFFDGTVNSLFAMRAAAG